MGAPALSLVVVESAPGAVNPRFFEAVAAEAAAGRLEVLVVSTTTPEAAGELPGVRWVPSPDDATVPRRRGSGLAEARAPLVALTESFCVPVAGWFDAVVAAHEAHDVVAVGGPVDRRQGGARDWALTLVEYGRFMGPAPEGPVPDLPGINVAYRVETLRRVLGALPAEIVEVELHRTLRQAGEVLWRAPAAVMFDESRMPAGSARRTQFQHGRLFGAQRLQGAGVAPRLGRAALTPAVPLVLGARIARGAFGARRGGHLMRSLPWLVGLLASWTAGELAGSLMGPGRAAEGWR